MKLVKYEDMEGWKRQSYIKEDMPDNEAPMGVPNDVPDLRQIDMNEALRELNNLLFDRGIFTLKDVSQKQNQLRNAVELIFFKRVFDLYKNNNQNSLEEVSNG